MYSTPSHITIRGIQLDPGKLQGKAQLFLGEEQSTEELTLWMSETGWLTFSLPLFHSPLGAPATYGAVALSPKTEAVITKAVQALLPRLLALGINPKTGQWVTTSTALKERIINISAFNEALDRVTRPHYAFVQNVETV